MSKHLGDKLIDYAWGMLTPQEQAQADEHLYECADCRAKLAGHQKLVGKLASTIPAMLPDVPPHVRAGWSQVAARIPHLRKTVTPQCHGLSGFIAVGLAMSTAVLLLVVVMTQAWLARPPLTATALYPTLRATPIASATATPEHPTAVATPVSWLYATLPEAPRPLPARSVATAKP